MEKWWIVYSLERDFKWEDKNVFRNELHYSNEIKLVEDCQDIGIVKLLVMLFEMSRVMTKLLYLSFDALLSVSNLRKTPCVNGVWPKLRNCCAMGSDVTLCTPIGVRSGVLSTKAFSAM